MAAYTDVHSHCCDNSNSPSSSSARPLHQFPSSRQPRHGPTSKSTTKNIDEARDGLLQLAAMELEAMRRPPSPPNERAIGGKSGGIGGSAVPPHRPAATEEEVERSFPPACLHLLHALPGNSRCHDCDAVPASWASVSYGITLCLQCSGKHRGLGVNRSFVKSLALDSWKRREILCMLEGGNEQLNVFFDRHGMGGGDEEQSCGGGNEAKRCVGVFDRYKTKAASFYRQHLMSHARKLVEGGTYEGREASRRRSGGKQQRNKAKSGGKSKSRRKPREQPMQPQLPTVTEKEAVDRVCGRVGA